jgi:hypothetical protein
MTARRTAWSLVAAVLVVVASISGADEPKSFASPVAAGCYLARDGNCYIHVEPFTANVAPGERLERFQLKANGVVIYDFSMDVSNAPIDDYAPSLVALDFLATCDVAYTVSALTKDSGDAGLGVAGVSEPFSCPPDNPIPVRLLRFEVD